MTLYLYRVGTQCPISVIENAASYTADEITDADGTVFGPIADGYELSAESDCSQALRARWREEHPTDETRIDELESLVAALCFGGESE